MKVLGISGWKRSGKDSLAEYLVLNHQAKRVAFADPLKDMAAEEFGVPRSHFDDPLYKEAPIASMPVEPKDKFSQMVTDFMKLEFRSLGGFQYNVVSEDTKLFWTPRALAILKGSTNRSVDTAFWVKRAIEVIRMSNSDIVVVPDMRYRSEMAQLKEAFGSNFNSIRVNRFETSPSQDPSERDLDNAEFDFTIKNNGTLEDLFVATEFVLASIK